MLLVNVYQMALVKCLKAHFFKGYNMNDWVKSFKEPNKICLLAFQPM